MAASAAADLSAVVNNPIRTMKVGINGSVISAIAVDFRS